MLRRLNRHFGKHIRIDWRPLIDLQAAAGRTTLPTFLHVDGIIRLGGDERILDPQILAHEYAHFLSTLRDCTTGDYYKRTHPEIFFERYRGVCQVLGIPPLLSDIAAIERFVREIGIE